MVRRTKEEAEATRQSLLDAAERLFQAHGVSQTSLQQIAQEAGATRGAIYWHFQDKADLFNAMMERVTLPLEQAVTAVDGPGADPLLRVRAGLRDALHRVVHDPQLRRVFEVATHKVEYVGEMQAVHQRHLLSRNLCVAHLETQLRRAARHHGVRLAMPAAQAAHVVHAVVDGLIHNWLLDPQAFELAGTGARAVDVALAGLGLPPPAPSKRGRVLGG